ncbi:MAG: BrnT family toxin [Candidatus Margulisiibacteriota bacterium]
MEIQYDKEKSKSNKAKHGVDFEEVKQIWNNPYVEFSARSNYENRYAAIGYINKKLYTCIFCLRGDSARIISCRRAREGEVKLYEKELGKTEK